MAGKKATVTLPPSAPDERIDELHREIEAVKGTLQSAMQMQYEAIMERFDNLSICQEGVESSKKRPTEEEHGGHSLSSG